MSTVESTKYLLTTADAARAIGFSPGTLRNWRSSGLGPRPTRLSANDVRYDPADIEAWVKAVKHVGSVQAVPYDASADHS